MTAFGVILVVLIVLVFYGVLFIGIGWFIEGEPLWAGLVRKRKEKRKKLIKDLEL